ncbi:MAG: hypothetical protein K2X69_11775, partial [Silvanigrellaceae bacterium]|nr:hypothetical protein [Silvanigrellaceae bacterium]
MDFKISDLVNQLYMQEVTFKTMVKAESFPSYYNQILAGKIISNRMFLYFNEKMIRKQMRKNPVQYYYEYLNSIINDVETNYRNLVLFEINELVDKMEIDFKKEDIEKMFLIEFHESIFMTYKYILKKELSIDVGVENNSKEIIGILKELDNSTNKEEYRVKYLIGALAHINNSVSIDNISELILYPNTSEKSANEIMVGFNRFIDEIIGKYYEYDRPEFFICLLLLAIQR